MGRTGKKVLVVTAVTILFGAGVFITDRGTNRIVGTEVKDDYQPLEEKKEYTVLLYMNGSDLETDRNDASRDLEEILKIMSKIGETGEINFHVAVETGGSSKWNEQRRFQITPCGERHIEKTKPKNMGDADTLADFLNYGIMSYPADKYILICWDHGSGPIDGFGSDEVFDGDSLKLQEVQEAFDLSEMGKHTFEAVGFDACLMGTVETVYMMPNNVKYVVASPELESEEGWDYSWLEVLNGSGLTGEEIGKSVGKAYEKSQENQKIPMAVTVADVKKVQESCEEWSRFLEKKTWEEEEIQAFLKETEYLEKFYTDIYDMQGSELVGCESLMNNMCKNFLEGATEKYGNDEAKKKNSTLSIYFPEKEPEEKDIEIYESCGFIKEYYEMLEHLVCFLRRTEDFYEKEAYPYSDKIVATLSKEQYETMICAVQVTYMKGEGQDRYVISTDSDVTVNAREHILSAVTPEEYMGLQGEVFAAIEEEVIQTEEEDVVYMQSPVLYEDVLGKLKIRFSDEYPAGEILGVIEISEDGKSSKKIHPLEEGVRLTPLYPKEEWMYGTGGEKFVRGNTITVEWFCEEHSMEAIEVDKEMIEYQFLVK